MTNKSDNADHLHMNNVYFPKRKIFLHGEINEKLYSSLTKNLCILDNSSGRIDIEINSEGGCVATCKAMFDVIKRCENFVAINVCGTAFSSASLLLQAADKGGRSMTPNSDLMIHIGQDATPTDHPVNNMRLQDYYNQLEKWMIRAYMERIREKHPRYTIKKFKELLLFDTYFNAKQALDFGLIDKIGE